MSEKPRALEGIVTWRPVPRWRRAWCELTGGHDSQIMPAWQRGEAFAVQLQCERCGYRTHWFNIPKPGDGP